ncbi:nuclear factor NF-kappa-B p100 subunit-like [Mya arenaria]|uniref:nuclear factor NF-kappa-B p100 subunit-like n=1 Tax=Mya arenaria TaxID=6604 RepID=UPI0022E76D7A|nr:nuclear factor NF-kappa-B p100 subunit-like [Mya arenaria]
MAEHNFPRQSSDPYSNYSKTDYAFSDADEHKLSTDLDSALRLDAVGLIKSEVQVSCRYGNDSAFPNTTVPYPGEPFPAIQDGSLQYPLYTTTGVKSELTDVPWHQPVHPGPWRQQYNDPPSVPTTSDLNSINEVETDEAPSFAPTYFDHSQHDAFNARLQGKHPHPAVTGIQTVDARGGRPSYPFEDKLMKYEGDDENCPSVGSMQKHSKWVENVQHQQFSQMSSAGQEMADNTVVDEETMTFEADELGDGPLHTLVAVEDRRILAQALEVLVKTNVVPQCIDLQNKCKQTPVFLAAMIANYPYASWLVDHGADTNIQGTIYTDADSYIWRAPLHVAVNLGDASGLQIVIMLLNAPVTDVNIRSHGDKLTALHVALKKHAQDGSCRQIIMELLKREADVNIREQSSSKTPLMMAVETRDLDLITDFLAGFPAERRRKMLQEQTRGGDTCLHLAAGLSRLESQQKVVLLRMLVTNGANGSIPNNVKEYPKDFARHEWNQLRRT